MAVNAQMQWHKWLTTCTGAPPLRPFFIAKSFFDRLIIYLLYNGIVWGIAWGLFCKNEKCLNFYLKGLKKAVKYVILIVYGN